MKNWENQSKMPLISKLYFFNIFILDSNEKLFNTIILKIKIFT